MFRRQQQNGLTPWPFDEKREFASYGKRSEANHLADYSGFVAIGSTFDNARSSIDVGCDCPELETVACGIELASLMRRNHVYQPVAFSHFSQLLNPVGEQESREVSVVLFGAIALGDHGQDFVLCVHILVSLSVAVYSSGIVKNARAKAPA